MRSQIRHAFFTTLLPSPRCRAHECRHCQKVIDSKPTRMAHRVVWTAFSGPVPSDSRRIDEDRWNIAEENRIWVSPLEHFRRHGFGRTIETAIAPAGGVGANTARSLLWLLSGERLHTRGGGGSHCREQVVSFCARVLRAWSAWSRGTRVVAGLGRLQR